MGFRSFFTFWAKISYIYILIPSDNCFQANFKEFCMFFSVKFVGIVAIFEHEDQKCGKNNPTKLTECCITTLHSSVFKKVRHLVGEINYFHCGFTTC